MGTFIRGQRGYVYQSHRVGISLLLFWGVCLPVLGWAEYQSRKGNECHKVTGCRVADLLCCEMCSAVYHLTWLVILFTDWVTCCAMRCALRSIIWPDWLFCLQTGWPPVLWDVFCGLLSHLIGYSVYRLGDLLCCETCSAVYHLTCVDPPMAEVPEDDWHCGVCVAHKVRTTSSPQLGFILEAAFF